MGKVDATENQQLGEKYQIKEFPVLKVFPPGDRKDQPEAFGARQADLIIRQGLEKLDQYGILSPITQFTNVETLNATCQKHVCIIGFLPHIYDSSVEERNRYIEVIQQVLRKNRGKPISFLWAQAGDHYKFEQLVGVGMGYPAVIGISLPKSRFALMRSAFSLEELTTFVRDRKSVV